MSIASDTLRSTVAAETNAEEAALLLLNGLVDQLDAVGADLNKLGAMTSELRANKEAYAEAVVANTARAGMA